MKDSFIWLLTGIITMAASIACEKIPAGGIETAFPGSGPDKGRRTADLVMNPAGLGTRAQMKTF